jgi:CHAT domain-containing protein
MYLALIWALVVGVPAAGGGVSPSGSPVSATLGPGQVQVQELTLAASDRIHLTVDQPHLDVEVRVIGPSGGIIASAANPAPLRSGRVSLTAVAAEPGLHRVEVRLQAPTSAPGPVQLTVDPPRPAVEADRRRIEAERLRDQADHRALADDASLADLSRSEYRQAAAIWRELGDPRELAITLEHHGSYLEHLGELTEAQALAQEALTLEQQTGNRVGEVDCLDLLGLLATELGDPPGAVQLLNRALTLRRSLGPDPISEASVLNDLAIALGNQGDFAQAVDRYSEALALAQTTGDQVFVAVILKNRAADLGILGQFDRALADSRQACLAFRTLKAVSSEGVCEFNTGNVYGDMRQPTDALVHYRRALPLLERGGDQRFLAFTWNKIGLSELQLGRPAAAASAFDTALAGHLRSGDRRSAEVTRANQARVLLDTGHPGAARERLEVSRRTLHALGDRSNEAQVLTDLAAAELQLGFLEAARAHLLEALKITEVTRSSIQGPTARASYLAAEHDRFGLLVDVLMAMHPRSPEGGWAAEALRAAESGRARSFLELLSEARVDVRNDVPEALRTEERALDLKLDAALRAERKTLTGGRPQDADRLEQSLEALRVEREELQARMRAASPGYRALTDPTPLDLSKIRSQVLDPDTVLVEYLLGERRSYVWVLSGDSLASAVLPGRRTIEAAALRVYRAWSQPASTDDGRGVAKALSRMVLGPVAEALGSKGLLVVADGALQQIPFGALPDPGTGQPLLASRPVVYAPSASAVALLRQAPRPPAMGVEVAVLADPVFGANDARLGGKRKAAAPLPADLLRSMEDTGLTHLPPLTATRREAEAIAAHAGASETFSALGFDASRATALGPTVAGAGVVHLATHALLDPRRPELSGVVLSLVDQDGVPQDGFLSMGDLYRLHLDAELVVLSACRTGLGKEVRGEGLVGLTRGFMYAGSPRVVASLWKVSDRATARLMDRFYAALFGEKLAPAEALRKAQRELSKERGFSAPFAWAAFVLQGEWRPMRVR